MSNEEGWGGDTPRMDSDAAASDAATRRNKEQAFPVAGAFGHKGMTLRDYFAGQVAATILAETASARIIPDGVGTAPDIVAQMAYTLADALLIERERGQ